MVEKLINAGFNTIIGITIVFAVLILISFIISLFKYIPNLERYLAERKKKKEAKKNAKKNKNKSAEFVEKTIEQIVEKEEKVSDDLELIAVITAAICAATNQSSDSFVVRSVKKVAKKGY